MLQKSRGFWSVSGRQWYSQYAAVGPFSGTCMPPAHGPQQWWGGSRNQDWYLFFQSQKKLTDNVEIQNQMVCGTSKANACLREGVCGVRRYKHPFSSLQFLHSYLVLWDFLEAKKDRIIPCVRSCQQIS